MFKVMYDLESLTEAQRQEYYQAACEHYQVPAELNLLAFIWLDGQDGKRTLTLYAKKGATDIIRGNLGISTTRLIKDAGEGYVAWIAEGVDRNGRIEQAVGSASTEGLKGQALASAVMIAQTRATRRMTLQFIGGGLLDESEIHGSMSDISRSSVPLAALATLPAPEQPVVALNSEAGKDITKITEVIPEPSAPRIQTTAAPAEQPKRRRRRTKAEIEAAKGQPAPQTIAEQAIEKVVDEQVHKAAEELGMTPSPIAEKVLVNEITEQAAVINRVVEQAAAELGTAIVEHVNNKVKEPLIYPTKEQEDGFRKRLAHYTGDVLKKGGMTDGIIWRIRKYTLSLFPDALVENGRIKLTVSQWEIFLKGLDDQLVDSSPTELVRIINLIAEKV